MKINKENLRDVTFNIIFAIVITFLFLTVTVKIFSLPIYSGVTIEQKVSDENNYVAEKSTTDTVKELTK